KDRVHIGGEGALQSLRGHQRIVSFLIVGESLAIHQQRLGVCSCELDGADDETLNGISDVMRLVEHMSQSGICCAATLGVNQFVEDEKQLKRIDRPRIEVIITVLGIIEVESTEAPRVNEPRHNHLDVYS